MSQNAGLSQAYSYYVRGNLPQAELYCRQLIQAGQQMSGAYVLLGLICTAAGLHAQARQYFEEAHTLNPEERLAEHHLDAATPRLWAPAASRAEDENAEHSKYILIKAWGYGFWADMDHVFGQLLLAELTQRTPIIHWGGNSLFKAPTATEAFRQFFEPVSPFSLKDLQGQSYSFYPNKWSARNLIKNNLNKFSGSGSRLAGFFTLARSEDVVVSDFHTYVRDLLPWIPPSHHLHGLDIQDIYRGLINKYIRLRVEILEEVDRYWNENLAGTRVVAAHMRGTDKVAESAKLEDTNRRCFQIIGNQLREASDAVLFLLTDDEDIRAEAARKFANRVKYTRCFRTKGTEGTHYQENANPEELGREVLIDSYLASRCDRFIGNGHSNVSTAILHLKDWKPENVILLEENNLFVPQLFLHEW